MSMTLHREDGNVYRLEIQGTLREIELRRCQQELADEIHRVGPVRLLFHLDRFHGWDPAASWSDLSFYVRHGPSVERIAIVGEERWRSEALMFAGADLRRAPVQFFGGDLAAARAWLEQ